MSISTIEDHRNELLRQLKRALDSTTPMDELSIIQAAITRIQAQKTLINAEHDDCVRIAHEVLPDAVLFFGHQACWVMNAEIKRLRAQLKSRGEV